MRRSWDGASLAAGVMGQGGAVIGPEWDTSGCPSAGQAKLVRMTAELIRRIADWRQEQSDLPTEAETIRRLIEAGLEAVEGKKRHDSAEGRPSFG